MYIPHIGQQAPTGRTGFLHKVFFRQRPDARISAHLDTLPCAGKLNTKIVVAFHILFLM